MNTTPYRDAAILAAAKAARCQQLLCEDFNDSQDSDLQWKSPEIQILITRHGPGWPFRK